MEKLMSYNWVAFFVDIFGEEAPFNVNWSVSISISVAALSSKLVWCSLLEFGNPFPWDIERQIMTFLNSFLQNA